MCCQQDLLYLWNETCLRDDLSAGVSHSLHGHLSMQWTMPLTPWMRGDTGGQMVTGVPGPHSFPISETVQLLWLPCLDTGYILQFYPSSVFLFLAFVVFLVFNSFFSVRNYKQKFSVHHSADSNFKHEFLDHSSQICSPALLTQPPLTQSSYLAVNYQFLQASNTASPGSMSCGRTMSIASIKVWFVNTALRMVEKWDLSGIPKSFHHNLCNKLRLQFKHWTFLGKTVSLWKCGTLAFLFKHDFFPVFHMLQYNPSPWEKGANKAGWKQTSFGWELEPENCYLIWTFSSTVLLSCWTTWFAIDPGLFSWGRKVMHYGLHILIKKHSSETQTDHQITDKFNCIRQ